MLGLLITASATAIFGVTDVDKGLLEMARTFRMPTDRQLRYIYGPFLTRRFVKTLVIGMPIGLVIGIATAVIQLAA